MGLVGNHVTYTILRYVMRTGKMATTQNMVVKKVLTVYFITRTCAQTPLNHINVSTVSVLIDGICHIP